MSVHLVKFFYLLSEYGLPYLILFYLLYSFLRSVFERLYVGERHPVRSAYRPHRGSLYRQNDHMYLVKNSSSLPLLTPSIVFLFTRHGVQIPSSRLSPSFPPCFLWFSADTTAVFSIIFFSRTFTFSSTTFTITLWRILLFFTYL